jgi:CRP-like cAMP-binding protein
MRASAQPNQNRLIAALPAVEAQRWLPLLESVDMPLGSVLYESGGTLSHVYFPTTAIVSLLYVMENGASAEIAVVGNEGIVGVSLFMGGESTPSRAVVQSAGRGLRLEANRMKDEFNRGGPVLHLLLRYTQALITQMAQTAVCNRHHTLDQQLCRWLLLSLDRLPGNQLVMTQELIANMLGVRREGVTEGALKLERTRYPRGTIYTCPMHPQIRRSEPGSCPICGMALEPEGIPEAEGTSPELKDMTRRFVIGAVLATPIFVLEMGGHLPVLNLDHYVSMAASMWIQFALATPIVLWCAWPFFQRAWASVLNRSPNMFTLIALGVGASYLYSLVATFAPGFSPRAFVSTAADPGLLRSRRGGHGSRVAGSGP